MANNLTNEDLRQITDIVPYCQFHHENFSWCPPPLVKISIKFCRFNIYIQCYLAKHSVKGVPHHEIFSWWYKYSYIKFRGKFLNLIPEDQFHHENFSWCPPPLMTRSLKFCRSIIYTQCYLENIVSKGFSTTRFSHGGIYKVSRQIA